MAWDFSKIDADETIMAAQEGDYLGYCLCCGYQQGGCEPDAHEYECEDCGELTVYGAQELVIMGACG
jgi:Zn finger protein HypA/HybF involved in hydrogenase expression